jgi:hypothetical protein
VTWIVPAIAAYDARTMPPGVHAAVPLLARAYLKAPGLIEIKCTGNLRAEDAGYLPRLGRLIDDQHGRVSILFDALELESYSPKFPLAHIDFFRDYHARLGRIAVAHVLKSVSFAIATVSLASNTDIEGFPSLAEATTWLAKG